MDAITVTIGARPKQATSDCRRLSLPGPRVRRKVVAVRPWMIRARRFESSFTKCRRPTRWSPVGGVASPLVVYTEAENARFVGAPRQGHATAGRSNGAKAPKGHRIAVAVAKVIE